MSGKYKHPFAAQVHRFLEKHGHTLVDRLNPPSHVEVSIRGSAAIAIMNFAGTKAVVVIKPTWPHMETTHPEEICHLQKTVRNINERLASSLPPLQVTGPQRQWIFMNFIQGRTLEDVLAHNNSRVSNSRGSQTTGVLEMLGEIVASIHQIEGARIGFGVESRANETYFPHLEKYWNTSIFPRLLPARFRQPEALRQFLPAGFGARRPACLSYTDLQPKNIIIDADGELHVIDPGYELGNPAMAIGFFLNSLNQLSLSHRNWLNPVTIQKYQREFLSTYLSRVGPNVSQDLIFFYPWTLIETARMHNQRRPNLWLGLRTVYSLYMRQYLKNLELASAKTLNQPHAELFTGVIAVR